MENIKKLRTFREELRSEIIPNYYSAKAHLILLSIIVPITTIFPLLGLKISFEGISLFLGTILIINFYFYLIHRFLLHKSVKGFKWCYKMHMIHHRLYDEKNMQYEKLNDIYMLLMPPAITFLYYIIMIPFIYFISTVLFSRDLAMFSISGAFFFWGLYELNHFIEHLNQNNPIFKINFFKYIRTHHEKHHNHKLMNKVNFDIALGFKDYLFKTNA
jgi:hypothetical protein